MHMGGQRCSDSIPMNQAVFLKPPPHGLIANWLGPEMVQRLLDFAQEQRDSFFPSGVGYGEYSRIDANVRHSGRITKLGDLKQELRTQIRAVLPTMFRQLGADAFEPGRIEVEMVAHGDGALFTEHRDNAVEDKKFVIRRVVTAGRFQAVFCGFILSPAAKTPPPLSISSQTTIHWRFSRHGFHMRFFRWLAPRAGSRIRVLQ
jgi:hypothetical protein